MSRTPDTWIIAAQCPSRLGTVDVLRLAYTDVELTAGGIRERRDRSRQLCGLDLDCLQVCVVSFL